jgi:hypothetical protein
VKRLICFFLNHPMEIKEFGVQPYVSYAGVCKRCNMHEFNDYTWWPKEEK